MTTFANQFNFHNQIGKRTGSARRDALRRAALPCGPLPRWLVYQELPAVAVDPAATPTAETRRQADLLWGQLQLGGYKQEKKRAYFALLLHAAKQAIYLRGCVMYGRSLHNGASSKAALQVADAAANAGFFASYRSPPGSPRQSRLLPLPPLAAVAEADPWAYDVNTHPLVYLRRRHSDGEELEFDPADPTPARVQAALALVNRVNARCRITYRPYDEWEDCLAGERQLRPTHYAIFTDNWEHHGRIYTGRYGHQGLRRLERQTIAFDGVASVELDYGGLHPRLLYHLAGTEYRGDPYALWPDTTPARRLLAKRLINAAINAADRRAAIAACNQATNPRTETGAWRAGKDGYDARMLAAARRQTGLRFADIYDLAAQHHAPIARHFGSGAGMRLMNIDGAIALDVLHLFATRGVPVLGLHDSFIVPQPFAADLKAAMANAYAARVGFQPAIKP